MHYEDPTLISGGHTPVPRPGYRVGMPAAGRWAEVLNSDDARWGGTGVGHPRGVTTEAEPWHEREHSAVLDLPPLGVVLLQRVKPRAARTRRAQTGGGG